MDNNQKRNDKNNKLSMKRKKTIISNSYELKYVTIPSKRRKNKRDNILLHKRKCRINWEKKNLKIVLLWISINLFLQVLLLKKIKTSLVSLCYSSSSSNQPSGVKNKVLLLTRISLKGGKYKISLKNRIRLLKNQQKNKKIN